MANMPNTTKLALYHIRVQEKLDSEWSDWFGDVTINNDGPTTLLVCQIVDQSALHSLLRQIRDLSLTLISVNRIHPPTDG